MIFPILPFMIHDFFPNIAPSQIGKVNIFYYSKLFLIRHSKTSFEKNCFSAWASTLNMGLINKVDVVCLSPVGYGV